MPRNFPEAWQSRVRELLSTTHVADFLDGIPELDAQIMVDPVTDQNTIHIPLETFTPDVLINNTTYPIEVQDHDDGTKTVNLDKYQTKATRISEDQALGASYDKIDSASRGHVKAINRDKYKKAIHALAPAAHSTSTPVIALAPNYTAEDVYKKIVALKGAFDKMEVPAEGRRLNLAPDHANALLTSEKYSAALYADKQSGKISGILAGFKVYGYVGGPYFTTAGTKVAFKAVPGATDKVASVAFYEDNVGKKTGILKQYYDAPTTTNQANLLNYRHYFIVLPIKQEAIGAIYESA
ncbi:phage major capsid protein [Sphingobacterium psychroaquaticum]|uniref:Phage major capsid protein E n=1 Tax=Sphingobacterium psychroaquaticum TaxID=561061 RepID=A0A1X7K475_9SPHI|nr:hypothetical protein [Sphingobacterium psychroaquaticum]SMG35524.1 hypothetical protein SAMN05660862_2525 [Sphingobacterium psychroaquaticum]